MIDREKVIKDLEFCVNGHFKVELSLATKILALLKDEKEYCDKCAESAIKTTVELQEQIARLRSLLKEQEAVKPKCKERIGGFVAGLCPTCGTVLNNVHNVKACGKCGQAVKWE